MRKNIDIYKDKVRTAGEKVSIDLTFSLFFLESGAIMKSWEEILWELWGIFCKALKPILKEK